MFELIEQKLKKINELKEKMNEYIDKEEKMKEEIENFLKEKLSFLKDLEDLGVENFEVEYNGYAFDLEKLKVYRKGFSGSIFDDAESLAFFLEHLECILSQFLDSTIIWLSESVDVCKEAYEHFKKAYDVYKLKYK